MLIQRILTEVQYVTRAIRAIVARRRLKYRWLFTVGTGSSGICCPDCGSTDLAMCASGFFPRFLHADCFSWMCGNRRAADIRKTRDDTMQGQRLHPRSRTGRCAEPPRLSRRSHTSVSPWCMTPRSPRAVYCPDHRAAPRTREPDSRRFGMRVQRVYAHGRHALDRTLLSKPCVLALVAMPKSRRAFPARTPRYCVQLSETGRGNHARRWLTTIDIRNDWRNPRSRCPLRIFNEQVGRQLGCRSRSPGRWPYATAFEGQPTWACIAMEFGLLPIQNARAGR